MKKSIMSFFAFLCIILILPGCNGKKGVSEDKLLGDWYTVKGNVEAYSFMKDNDSYIFSGTLHESPFTYGTFKIEKDKFIMTMDDGKSKSFSFTMANDTLVFNNGDEIYTRTKPLEVLFPEVRILKDIASAFSSHKFTKPAPSDLKWGVWVDSLKKSTDLDMKGYSVIMTSIILGNDLESISGFLADHGFTRDSVYLTETCNGFWDENQVVTLCTSQNPNVSDEINVIISSAFVK